MSLHSLLPAKPGLDIGFSHLGRGAEVLKEQRSDAGGDLDEILTRGWDFDGHGGAKRMEEEERDGKGGYKIQTVEGTVQFCRFGTIRSRPV